MKATDIAPCGIDCVNCEYHIENGQEELWKRAAAFLKTTPEEVACKGCRLQGGCSVHKDCATLSCVNGRGLESCGNCSDFPCRRLMPLVERADKVPHNLKVYNLCRIKAIGAEAFLEESKQNRIRYFTGRFVIGAGPQLPGDGEE